LKKLDLGQTLQLLGNVGVILGILLLVFELNQNRDMMRAQTRNELARGLNDVLSLTISDPGLSEIIVRANAGEQLTPPESLRLVQRTELAFRYWENVHYQYRQDLYDESEFSRHADTIATVLTGSQNMLPFWCDQRLLYSVPFMEFIDELLAESECSK